MKKIKILARCFFYGLIFGAVGWFSYALFLDFSYPFDGSMLAGDSIRDVYSQKIVFAASFILLGLVIGAYAGKGLKAVSALLGIAAMVMVLWVFFIRYRIDGSYGKIQRSTDLIVFKFHINDVPLYELGLVSAMAIIFVMAIYSLMKKGSF